MRVCATGLWHLGVVTAACLASVGHEVTAFDGDVQRIAELRGGRLPVAEPGLEELVRAGLESGRLSFFDNRGQALDGAEVLWIAYDTPVDDDDRADVDFAVRRRTELIEELSDDAFVVVSSQLPVGTTRRLERKRIAYIPENLRLGSAIDAFMHPDRVVVGLDSDDNRAVVERLLAPVTDRLEWTNVESAEMTKHALNALATSVTFANEIATLCERVGADAHDVARGLKTDARIGPRIPHPRPCVRGRDARTRRRGLDQDRRPRGRQRAVAVGDSSEQRGAPALAAANGRVSAQQERWAGRGVGARLQGRDRHPAAVERTDLVRGTRAARRDVRTHDPAIHALPPDLPGDIVLCATAAEALDGTAALVVATPWPEFRAVEPGELIARMREPNVVDTTGALRDTVGRDPR
jgi:UDPglucose 6-dehydrogenase